MPIEFYCTHCQRLLRTPDGTEGKDAKCPQCGAVMKIPQPPVVAHEAALAPPATANPYQAPAHGEGGMLALGPKPRRCFEPTQIEIGDVFDRTWRIFKKQWPACLAALWLPAVIVGLCYAIAVVAALAILHALGREVKGPEINLAWLVVFPVYWWSIVVVPMYMLKIARGERIAVHDAVSVGGILFPALIATLLVALAVMGGYVLCIVPGVILALMFSQYLNVMIDRRAGIIESLRLSSQATRGNKLTIFLLFLLVGIAGTVITFLTCFVGVLVVQPFAGLVQSVAYLSMTGQSTAADPVVEQERPLA